MKKPSETTTKMFGMLAASAVAGLIAATPAFASKKMEKKGESKSFCQNNQCKGHSDCSGHGNKNGCKGTNECKGQGWLMKSSKEDCEKDGKGKWVEQKA